MEGIQHNHGGDQHMMGAEASRGLLWRVLTFVHLAVAAGAKNQVLPV